MKKIYDVWKKDGIRVFFDAYGYLDNILEGEQIVIFYSSGRIDRSKFAKAEYESMVIKTKNEVLIGLPEGKIRERFFERYEDEKKMEKDGKIRTHLLRNLDKIKIGKMSFKLYIDVFKTKKKKDYVYSSTIGILDEENRMAALYGHWIRPSDAFENFKKLMKKMLEEAKEIDLILPPPYVSERFNEKTLEGSRHLSIKQFREIERLIRKDKRIRINVFNDREKLKYPEEIKEMGRIRKKYNLIPAANAIREEKGD